MGRCTDEGVIAECGEGELETSGNLKTDEWKDAESWGV